MVALSLSAGVSSPGYVVSTRHLNHRDSSTLQPKCHLRPRFYFSPKISQMTPRLNASLHHSNDSGPLDSNAKGDEKDYEIPIPASDGGGINGNDENGNPPGGGGDGKEENNGEEEPEDAEYGPLLSFEEVTKELESRGASLPPDMLEAAKTFGIRKLLLYRFLELQAAGGLLGFAMGAFSMLRNRMLADPAFLFKIGTEIVIDSCCATFAEAQKRGDDFWPEFELYLADLLVGVVVNVALVGMLAPYARFGETASSSASKSLIGRLISSYNNLPSSVFEAGSRFTVQQRIATYFCKGVMYGSVGFGCGIIGQGIANLIMTARRQVNSSEDDIPVPPLLKSAVLWGVFLAVSSNTRYQIVNGLERVVESSPAARKVPLLAMAFTVGVRFANNVYGGMQFVDWAKWTGVQ